MKKASQRHQDQRPEAVLPDCTYRTTRKASESSSGAGVERVPARQFLGLAVDLAGQLAEGDDRTGEGDSADEDAEEGFDPQDRATLRRGSCARARPQSRSARRAPLPTSSRDRRGEFEMRVEADEHGRKADEGCAEPRPAAAFPSSAPRLATTASRSRRGDGDHDDRRASQLARCRARKDRGR
jgi:hypothetical protein